ncbi:MAG: SIMPL domain-containing protein [Bacteroidetes bacterium]|nr:SIMPL domain-containing protein [Bacteroidota bacterium]
MKKSALALLALLFAISAFAQPAPAPRTISVTGRAQKIVVPDEIYVTVVLREFYRDKKKMTIEELEAGLVNFVVKTTATPATNIKMDDIDASFIALKRKQKDAIIEKKYEIKYNTFLKSNQLLAVMDSLNCRSAYISNLSHSKMDEFRREVRIEAMKDAQNKSTYMVEAVGAKLGKVLTVVEPGTVNVISGLNAIPGVYSNSALLKSYESSDSFRSAYEPQKTIEINYSVDVTFEIN